MRSWRRPALIGLLFLGIAVRPGASSWDNPVEGEWPDIVGDMFGTESVRGKSALWLLEKVQSLTGETAASVANAESTNTPLTPPQAAWKSAEHFKTNRFVWIVPLTPNEGWARALVALRHAEMASASGNWGTLNQCLDTTQSAPDTEPGWAAASANPGGTARHYIYAISLSANQPEPWGADPFVLPDINKALKKAKWLPDDPLANPIRWAHLVGANYAAQAGDWEYCYSEVDQCN